MKLRGAALACLLSASGVLAQGAPVETTVLGASKVALHLHGFLTAEDLATLRFVASNPDGLGLFIQNGARFAAIALAPEEGFLRGGQPVPSATAISDLPDSQTAREAAVARCNEMRQTKTPCVVTLEVSPAL